MVPLSDAAPRDAGDARSKTVRRPRPSPGLRTLRRLPTMPSPMSTDDRQRGEQIRSMIVKALGHLAEPADRQVRHLERVFGRSPLPGDFNVDELALEFNDVALAAHLAVEAGT